MNSLPAGPLQGRTLLRFAHAYSSGGGTERYLDDLDRSLLERSAARVIRLFLTRETTATPVREENVGRGSLVLVPLPTVPVPDGTPSATAAGRTDRLRDYFRSRILRHPLAWNLGVRRWNQGRRLRLLPGQAQEAGAATRQLLRQFPVDLAILHYVGGADAEEVLQATRAAGVPSVFLNHYSNDRLDHLAIRKHLDLVDGVAGVNGLDVPADLTAGFENLSDGIDTEFFRRDGLTSRTEPSARPILFLPARITREKGQLDLLKALALLVSSGIDCEIALAGRVDTSSFQQELATFAENQDLRDRVRVLGNLGSEQLREWYQKATLMVFPTYHHEGLPRVLLESQAMETPVVAYAAGGIAEGIEQGVTGYVVRKGDLQALVRRTADLLRTPAELRQMGLAGRRMVQSKFSLRRLAERHEQYYRAVLARRNASVASAR